MFSGNNGSKKRASKVENWTNKMNMYYSKVSDRKLYLDLKAAQFRVKNKTKGK